MRYVTRFSGLRHVNLDVYNNNNNNNQKHIVSQNQVSIEVYRLSSV